MVEHNIMLIFNSAVIEVYNLEIYSYFIDNFFVIAYINSYTLHGVLILVLFVCFTQELLCRHNSRLYVCTGNCLPEWLKLTDWYIVVDKYTCDKS